MEYREFFSDIDEEYPKTWNLETFKALQSFSKRIAYCNQHLQRISSGSSRIAYKIDEVMVLKLAKNRKGIAQNGVEKDRFIQQSYGDIAAKVFAVDENDLWLEMELAKKLTPNRFKSLVGTSPENVWRYLAGYHYEHKGKKRELEYWKNKIPTDELKKLEEEDSFGNRMVSLMLDMDFPIGDFGRISTYGEVLRNGTPSVILIDFGLNKSVLSDFYGVS